MQRPRRRIRLTAHGEIPRDVIPGIPGYSALPLLDIQPAETQPTRMRVWLINASAYRFIGRCRRSKHKKIDNMFKN